MLKRFFSLTITILLFVIAADAQSHKQILKQSPAPQQKPETDRRGTEQMPFVVKTIPTPKSETETELVRKEREEKASQAQWTIRLAWAVALATFLQAAFLFFTLRATQKAATAARDSAQAATGTLEVSREYSKHLEASLAIAQKSAHAADKSAYAAIETVSVMRDQYRAYLFIKVQLAPNIDDPYKRIRSNQRMPTQIIINDYALSSEKVMAAELAQA